MDLSKPVDDEFTRALPKIEASQAILSDAKLHAHLSGSISRQCLHEIWAQKKAQSPETFTLEDPLVAMPPGKVDYSLQTFFTTFSHTIYHLLTTLSDIRAATRSTLADFAADGVVYLELRTIPRASPAQSFTREEYLTTVLDTIAEFGLQQQQEQQQQPPANTSSLPSESGASPKKAAMTTNLILAIDRGTMTAQDAMEVVQLAIKYRSPNPSTRRSTHPHPRKTGGTVIGLDICGDPTKGDIALYAPALALAKAVGLGVTVHFAEVAPNPHQPRNQEEELRTLLDFEPDRLGHVIHVSAPIKQAIRQRRCALELCLSCNVHAGMVAGGFAEHHFGEWWADGTGQCVVVLCTDDVGFFCSPVSNEYRLAAEHFRLGRAEVLRLCRRSYGAIFGGAAETERLHKLLDDFEAGYKG
ncbi:putative adenosine deaminase [Aspergillus aculeatinus CBS 121060]|uniref:Metallo-dependent hydrolase n=1 Tax=Aspergillus aculeatinus CBS 121060 TaxID=1448322 RepID=A0ACD1GV30_9EURO|nr:Metallo-dependent hydrolase [Aspergillus aculeatinus CBS 121060]RAH65109.1 Metallo-dependent hydrolase [Aspergillus aculeatinus CBS 121060]